MSESALPTEQIETPKPVPHPAKEASSSGRLPLLIFIATLLGSLLGVLADASELTGSNLLEPVVKLFDPSPALHIAGSNTILGKELGMMSDWQAGFEALTGWENHIPLLGTLERKVQIEVSAVGTTAGFIETLQGKVNLFAASEPLKPEQQQALKEAGLEIQCAAVIGYDVIAFVTNFNNKVPEISTRQMTSILNDGYQDWADVGGESGSIRILARQGSGTTEIVLERLTGNGEYRPYFKPCTGNEDCLNTALSMPGSLYWVSRSWLLTQPPRHLRLILIKRGNLLAENPLKNTVALDPETGKETSDPDKNAQIFNPDNYPIKLIRPLYMYVIAGDGLDDKSTQLARDFLHYVRGIRGQEILSTHNFYPYFDPPAEVEPEYLPTFGTGLGGEPIICRQ